jgi:hydroxymethylpyrimidine pyrophosphatase-like HAD family hydrolase
MKRGIANKKIERLFGFDVDKTLTESKQPINRDMLEQLVRLMRLGDVCIISGNMMNQLENQIVMPLFNIEKIWEKIGNPERGVRLYVISSQGANCDTFYSMHNPHAANFQMPERINLWNTRIKDADIKKIKKVLETAARETNLWENNPRGKIIEIRDDGAQVTFSALGQEADPKDKKEWDPDRRKREKIKDKCAEIMKKYEFRISGGTSIDVCQRQINKAWGMNNLVRHIRDGYNCEMNGVTIPFQAKVLEGDNILYFGDEMGKEGNDYPIWQAGYKVIKVRTWEDTFYALQGINAVVMKNLYWN